jgi:hypothetical protein
VRCASFRSLEHWSRSFQSGPVGQCEYTNAAKGGGSDDLRNSTTELRGDFVGIKSSPAPRTWFFFLAFSRHCSIGTKAAECRFNTACASWPWLAQIASCPSSAAAPEWLQMQRRVVPSRRLRRLPPNPSIEGMPKRLRLLVTPHVKR